jgi:hypothetical protein
MAADSYKSQKKKAVAENSIVFPFLRVRGPLALIGLSSACPTAPGYATGSIGGPQLQLLDQLLIETGKGRLIHYSHRIDSSPTSDHYCQLAKAFN